VAGFRTVLIQRLVCLVGSVRGNQHLCMQRQHSSLATSTLGNTPNLNIGSYTKENTILRFRVLPSVEVRRDAGFLKRYKRCSLVVV